ncbi:MAG: glycosyltransferase [Lachnospiraceae bacterium]|nr:glycosyltransferase [Lachnospiraceae bacterium]
MSYTNNTKISIIVPVYNTERYIRQCLDSVLTQCFKNYEIVCVNDGSTDGSLGILKEYQKNDERVRIITTENGGLSAARNIGVQSAAGEYICYLDSDDMLENGALERMSYAIDDGYADVIGYNARLIYENEFTKEMYNKDAYYNRKGDYGDIVSGAKLFASMIEKNEFIETAWLMLIKKEYLEKNNICFYEGILHEDVLYAVQCYLNANKIKYVEDINYIYRIRENSIMTRSITSKNVYSRIVSYDEIMKLMYTHSYEARVEKALNKYLKRIIDDIRADIVRIERDELSSMKENLNCTQELCLYLAYDENYEEEKDRVRKLGFDQLLKQYDYVYIYGAGKVATKVYRYIDMIGETSRIKAFLVTNQVKNSEYMKKSVVSIQDKAVVEDIVDNNTLVIVAVQRKYHEEMVKELRQRGIKEYQIIDKKLEQMMDGEVL